MAPNMKRLFAFLLLGQALLASAAHGTGEPALSAEAKARLLNTLGEALRDQDITRQQYERSVYWVNASPCEGVDRQLVSGQQAQLETAIAKQQNLEKVRVFASFKSGNWFVVSSDASVGDSPYFIYAGNPANGAKPVAAWSGAATIFETSEVAEWVKQNAPGIPVQLANCFAWHVTLGTE